MLSKDPAEWERKIRKGGQKRDDFAKLARELPIKPLLDLFYEDTPVQEIADRLGLTPATVRRWQKEPDKTINYNLADRIAIKGLGMHPANVWGELWWVPEGEDHTWAWKYIDDPDYWT